VNECHDCVWYEKPGHSPPECTHPDRPDEEWPERYCEWKLSYSEAKYQNVEGL